MKYYMGNEFVINTDLDGMIDFFPGCESTEQSDMIFDIFRESTNEEFLDFAVEYASFEQVEEVLLDARFLNWKPEVLDVVSQLTDTENLEDFASILGVSYSVLIDFEE